MRTCSGYDTEQYIVRGQGSDGGIDGVRNDSIIR